jgi:methylmalonyl-CoA/ethylmalonyl-CoA epimerase
VGSLKGDHRNCLPSGWMVTALHPIINADHNRRIEYAAPRYSSDTIDWSLSNISVLVAMDRRKIIDPTARLHHVAFVVPSIPEAAEHLTRSLSCVWDERIVHIPEQTVWVSFVRRLTPDEPLFELVQPEDAKSRVAAFLKHGGGLHHLCYEVEDLQAEVKNAASAGSIIVQKPAPAMAFGGRRVVWAYTRDRLLLEYLER